MCDVVVSGARAGQGPALALPLQADHVPGPAGLAQCKGESPSQGDPAGGCRELSRNVKAMDIHKRIGDGKLN